MNIIKRDLPKLYASTLNALRASSLTQSGNFIQPQGQTEINPFSQAQAICDTLMVVT